MSTSHTSVPSKARSEPLLSTTAEHLQAECLQLAEKKQTKKKKRDSQARTVTVVVTVFFCFSTDGIPRKRQQGRKATESVRSI